jgi:hypothetical protein
MSKSVQSCQEIVKKESCQKIVKICEKENIGNNLKSSVSKTATISTPQKNVILSLLRWNKRIF